MEADSNRKPLKQSSAKHMQSSTSMDSLLSLSDVDFGMEEQTRGTEEVDGPGEPEKKVKVRAMVSECYYCTYALNLLIMVTLGTLLSEAWLGRIL